MAEIKTRIHEYFIVCKHNQKAKERHDCLDQLADATQIPSKQCHKLDTIKGRKTNNELQDPKKCHTSSPTFFLSILNLIR